MSKFDEKLSRMGFLMEYKMHENEAPSKVEYHTLGADGKVYGILREGTKYYIMTAEKGKENLSEAYQYIGGYLEKKKNEFSSYNRATQILEQKMIALNNSYGIHEDVSTVDMNRSEKVLEGLTKEARKELDRINLITENSFGIQKNIGNHGNPEGKGTSTGAQTEKNNKPFDDKTEAKMEEDIKASETDPKKANSDYTDASKSVEKMMTSDKAPTANDTNSQEKDYTNAKCDLPGESVIIKETYGFNDEDDVEDKNEELYSDYSLNDPDFDEETVPDNEDDLVGLEDDEDFDPYTEGYMDDFDDEEADLDELMEEFKERICGDDTTLTGPHGKLGSIAFERLGSKNRADEKQEALDGPKGSGNHIAFERLNESQKRHINTITNRVVDNLFEDKSNRALENMVTKVIMEELDEFGKHPRYGKEPMTTPKNYEVLKGTADHDWNDDSVKGNERYGKKIGNGAPFDIDVDSITDAVVDMVNKTLFEKKK